MKSLFLCIHTLDPKGPDITVYRWARKLDEVSPVVKTDLFIGGNSAITFQPTCDLYVSHPWGSEAVSGQIALPGCPRRLYGESRTTTEAGVLTIKVLITSMAVFSLFVRRSRKCYVEIIIKFVNYIAFVLGGKK